MGPDTLYRFECQLWVFCNQAEKDRFFRPRWHSRSFANALVGILDARSCALGQPQLSKPSPCSRNRTGSLVNDRLVPPPKSDKKSVTPNEKDPFVSLCLSSVNQNEIGVCWCHDKRRKTFLPTCGVSLLNGSSRRTDFLGKPGRGDEGRREDRPKTYLETDLNRSHWTIAKNTENVKSFFSLPPLFPWLCFATLCQCPFFLQAFSFKKPTNATEYSEKSVNVDLYLKRLNIFLETGPVWANFSDK